jgi:hypothetical protein
LGYRKAEKKSARATPNFSLPSFNVPLQLDELREFAPKFSQTDDHVSVEVKEQTFSLEKHLFQGVLACLAMAYVIFCHCATLICRKAGLKPGIWCWVPIVQWGFLFRAARLPAWWVGLALLLITIVPLWIIWSAKICRARGKGFLATLFLLLPPTTPLVFLYLAWSSEERPEVAPADKVRLAFQDAV